ncbi:glycosyltransferase [Undibacterium seohonense]|uniref:Glycosyltransferase n=1 Tax=Undibacterium seohonense TaxID=1344950 RepID=A0ABR6WZY1_9BURK|nr:glycosyltransferase [Undibacterium seohonense]MBC3806254.1 glycosyltransferase [Undibacterium seohonense]
MQVTSIHQFSFACSTGDGVTNSLFYIRKLLREFGFHSEIYSETIPNELRSEIKDLSELVDEDGTLLLSHHCMGYDNWKWLLGLRVPKVMVYHNITPIELLPDDGDIRRWAQLGRDQLHEWAPHFLGAIGVSSLNSEELTSNSYANVATIPLLVDFEKLRQVTPDFSGFDEFQHTYNVLFVGRICENKKQDELIEMMHHLRYRSRSPVRLILAGAVTSGLYKAVIEKRIRELGLDAHVSFVGKVSDERLLGLYQSADVFVSMSAHEGFGMPLIEAMQYELPVIARNSSNIAATLGSGGMLLPSHTNPWEFAQAVAKLMDAPALRRQILAKQHDNLERFSKRTVLSQLSTYLQQIGVTIPKPVEIQQGFDFSSRWRIEGPFDSTYSLAIVNRQLALALQAQGVDVSLRSHEGHGDFAPSASFLQSDPQCAHMYQRELSEKMPPYAALRFCYPPYVNDMAASVRVVHSYGWEETGFPQDYVDGFNRRLDLLTVLSNSVAKNLRDSGVRIPIAVTGAGVDHLLNLEPESLPVGLLDDCKQFTFLHISSCFPRKAVDVLLRAYGDAFRSTDDVSLLIKTFHNIHNEVQQQVDALRENDPEFPHVLISFEELSQAQMVSLYRAADAFVAPSRGEGLGLPMAEAMLFDLPVITNGWGGQTDFCDASTAWVCDFQFAKADTHLSLTHSLWAEPSMGHLTQLLREVHALDDADRRRKTDEAKKRVTQSLSWSKVAANVIAAMAALKQEALQPNTPKIGWLSTWNARCGIANYSQSLVQAIPQNRLLILANHIAERVEIDGPNVIRCWNASDSESLDYVLETALEQGLKSIVIQYNFSFFTLNTLALFIRRLKSEGISVFIFFHSTADVVLPEQTKSLRTIQHELQMVDRIFVHGIDDMNRLKAWGLLDNVIYFPHGIPRAQNQSSEPIALDSQEIVIASYGFLLPHKGILELIEAFAMLLDQRSNLHLLLLNAIYPVSVSQDLARQCRARITQLQLQDKITFISDFLTEAETQQLLSESDVIVFPYQETQESSSAAVRVGLAARKPVVVTPLSIFEDVDNVVLKLPGTNATQIAEGLHKLLATPETFLQRQEIADQWLSERDWPGLSNRLLNIIDGLANSFEVKA